MTPLAAVLFLVAAPPASPLPDGKTIDSLFFSFAERVPGLGPRGTLSMTADGKVMYSHATAPHTGSGGKITQLNWDIPKAEAGTIFRRLVADGLLTMPEPKANPYLSPAV